jgi:hypothetical protein
VQSQFLATKKTGYNFTINKQHYVAMF